MASLCFIRFMCYVSLCRATRREERGKISLLDGEESRVSLNLITNTVSNFLDYISSRVSVSSSFRRFSIFFDWKSFKFWFEFVELFLADLYYWQTVILFFGSLRAMNIFQHLRSDAILWLKKLHKYYAIFLKRNKNNNENRKEKVSDFPFKGFDICLEKHSKAGWEIEKAWKIFFPFLSLN